MRRLPLTDSDGNRFGYTVPDLILRHLHRIDQRMAGEVAMDEVVTSEREAGRRFLVNSHMEEAIRSLQLEGATTSRVAAKELLRSRREPRDRSELMIANNYRAVQFIKEMGSELTPDLVLELHRIVTAGTLDDPDAAGRLQRPDEERIAVFYRDDDRLPIHVPPPAEQLPNRLEALAYDHPFEDGKGGPRGSCSSG